jgi:hypothetical protein
LRLGIEEVFKLKQQFASIGWKPGTARFEACTPKRHPIIAFLVVALLAACAPAQKPAASQPPESTNAPVAIATSLPAPPPTETAVQIPAASPTSAAASACTAEAGDWATPAGGETPAIIFTINDCTLTVVMVMGQINSGWVTVSNNASQPIHGASFDYPYSFSEQDRYELSGTFTSAASAEIRLVFFKGFHFTTDGPALAEDLIFTATATR